jgi:single-stranded DNA-binding protein
MVEGRLKLSSWETNEGVKRNKLNIVAENINLTPSNPNPRGNPQGNTESFNKPALASSASEGVEDTPF